jgi:dTMP kinase
MAEKIMKMNKSVSMRVHPENDNWFGKKARHFLFLTGKSAHFASALFYMIDVIRSIFLYSWRKNDFIIFVRYLMGTAYLPTPLHVIGYNFFSAIVPKSKNMFFLDVNPRTAATRIRENRSDIEMFENLSSLEKIRSKALSLTRFDNWIIIDSNQQAEAIADDLEKRVF